MKLEEIDPDKDYILFKNGRFMIAPGQTFINLLKEYNEDFIENLKECE
jgi:hypothetical protein